MIIDLARPLLDWTNPQKAIKQNLNVLLAMFADAGIVAAVYFGIRSLVKAGVGIHAIHRPALCRTHSAFVVELLWRSANSPTSAIGKSNKQGFPRSWQILRGEIVQALRKIGIRLDRHIPEC